MDGWVGERSRGGRKVSHKIKMIAKKTKRVLQTILICSAGSRELKKGISQDCPPIFKDPQDDF